LGLLPLDGIEDPVARFRLASSQLSDSRPY
jgi:hypothetical protein